MKDDFQITEGDPLEFTMAAAHNNGVSFIRKAATTREQPFRSLESTVCDSHQVIDEG